MKSICRVSNVVAYHRWAESKSNPKPWDIYSLFSTKIPVLALRFVDGDEKNWPLTWKGKYLRLAIQLALDVLKSWQAYRPLRAHVVISRLERILPRIILAFQYSLNEEYKISSIRDIRRLSLVERKALLIQMLDAIEEISSIKNPKNPMLAA